MSWGKLDDSLPTHEKYVNLSQGAKLTCIHAILYASRELTDGKLVQGALNIIFAESDVSGPDKTHVRQELLAILPGHQFGLWEEREGVIWIHDYLKYQPSKEQVLKQRAENKRRVEEFRARQLAEARNDVSNAITNTVTSRINNEGTNGGTNPATSAATKQPPSPPKPLPGAGNGISNAITNTVTNAVTNDVNNEHTNSNVAETPESPIPLKTKVKGSSSANTTGLPAAAFSELLSKGYTVEEIQRAKDVVEARPNHPKKVNNWAAYLSQVLTDLDIPKDEDIREKQSRVRDPDMEARIALTKESERLDQEREIREMEEAGRLDPWLKNRPKPKSAEEKQREAEEESARMKAVKQQVAAQIQKGELPNA